MEMTNGYTWSKTRLTGSGGTNALANKDLFVKIKNHLKTRGWSVLRSCDGAANYGAADYWLDSGDIVTAVPGSDHSWAVLGNDAICPGYQLCLDWGFASAVQLYAYVSVDGTGFTGGSLTARPTAADEAQVNLNGNNWTSYSSGTAPTANVWTSSDYRATKVVLGPTTVRGAWWFARPAEAPDWWVRPNVSMIHNGTCVHGDHDADTELWTTGIINGRRVTFGLGTLMVGTTRALMTAGVAGASGDAGGQWPCSPMWLLSGEAASPGVLGFVPDQWWLHSNATLALGDTFPGGGTKQQVVVGNMGFGNDGTDLTL
jgi:hypothetical protein